MVNALMLFIIDFSHSHPVVKELQNITDYKYVCDFPVWNDEAICPNDFSFNIIIVFFFMPCLVKS